MAGSIALGVCLAVFGGMMSGTYGLPMTRIRVWRWEHTWIAFCVVCAWLFPAAYAAVTTPNLGYVIATRSSIYVALCGIAWGFSSLLFGLGLNLVGQALTFGIVLSMSSTVGSLFPLLILSPEKAFTTVGIFDWVGLAIAVVGVCFLSWAGLAKAGEIADVATTAETLPIAKAADITEKPIDGEMDTPPDYPESFVLPLATPPIPTTPTYRRHHSKSQSKVKLGILICVAAGLLSLLNLGFALGSDIQQKALKSGAPAFAASAAVWLVAMSIGNLANLIYPAVLITKHGTWREYLCNGDWQVVAFDLGLILLMSATWFFGMVIYGIGAAMIGGTLGAALGWPIYMCAEVLTANVCSIIAGEWRGTKRKSRLIMIVGVTILLLSIGVLGVGSSFAVAQPPSSH